MVNYKNVVSSPIQFAYHAINMTPYSRNISPEALTHSVLVVNSSNTHHPQPPPLPTPDTYMRHLASMS